MKSSEESDGELQRMSREEDKGKLDEGLEAPMTRGRLKKLEEELQKKFNALQEISLEKEVRRSIHLSLIVYET